MSNSRPTQPPEQAAIRVIAYIDGFNLYFGLKSTSRRDHYWLNPRLLGTQLLKPGQVLVKTRYFTARVRAEASNPGKAQRQALYLEAIACEVDTEITYGHYLAKERRCHSCGSTWQAYEEKKTDVNIAVALLNDAADDLFDVALVVSGDSDLVPPIESISRRHPSKRVIVVFPPNRHSAELRRVAFSSFPLGRKTIGDAQFPDTYLKQDGFILQRPSRWAANNAAP